MKVILKDRFGFTKIYNDKYIEDIIKEGRLLEYSLIYPYKELVFDELTGYRIDSIKTLIFVWNRDSDLEDKKITFVEKHLI